MVEATPINPSDLGLLLGPADMSTAKASGSGAAIKITAKVPEQALPFMAARLDQAMPVGIFQPADDTPESERNDLSLWKCMVCTGC